MHITSQQTYGIGDGIDTIRTDVRNALLHTKRAAQRASVVSRTIPIGTELYGLWWDSGVGASAVPERTLEEMMKARNTGDWFNSFDGPLDVASQSDGFVYGSDVLPRTTGTTSASGELLLPQRLTLVPAEAFNVLCFAFFCMVSFEYWLACLLTYLLTYLLACLLA